MLALVLPLPWLLVGLFAARLRTRGQPGCFIFVGVFGWPQAYLLQRLGLSVAAAWALSLALMIVCPLLGYLLGMRLFNRRTNDPPP
jgi:hypothetical protein